MPDFIKVARSADVKENIGFPAAVNHIDIVLFRFKGKVYAFRDRCPHQGAPLHDGYIKDDCLVCRYHGWKFHLEDGSFVNNNTLKLKQFPVRENNGTIFVKAG